MSDIFKGLTGGGWAGLAAWIFPSGMTLGLFWILVYPQTTIHYAAFDSLTSSEKAAVWLIAAVIIGLFLNAISTPMYRFLEGYTWPRYFRKRGVARQREIKAKIEQSSGGEGWEGGLNDERLARFPRIDNEIAPTQLGNAMRAFETYGATRFGLDSQVFWTELSAVVPKYLQTELDRSRANVDFFIALFYLSAVFAVVTATAVIAADSSWLLISIATASVLSMFLWYQLAVMSTSYWGVAVQALVNIGRTKLAEAIGLQIPNDIDAERDMWWLVSESVYDNNAVSQKKLDKFRVRPPTKPTKKRRVR